MAKEPTKAAVKTPKLPKSLGACVDLYHDTREKRLEANRVTEGIKKDETFIAEHIINNVPKGDSGAIGKRYKGVVKTEDVFQVEDWEAFYKHIQKTGSFELLNRMLNQASVREHTDVLNEKLDLANAKQTDPTKKKPRKMLPGVKIFKAVKLSVTKV